MTLNKNYYEIIIIGGGVSGLYCSSIAKYFGYNVCVIEENKFLGGQINQLYPNKFIYDYPGKMKVKAKEVLDDIINQAKSNKTKIYLNKKIENIYKKNDLFYIETKNSIFTCSFLILATGIGNFLPIELSINGKIIKNEKVIYSVSENESIYKNKKIIILGGGDSAIDWANHFTTEKISNNITLIHRRNEYKANPANIEKVNKNKNIRKFLNFEIINLQKNILKIKNNESNEIKELDFDYVIVQYGQINNINKIDFFNQIEKNELNRFKVDINQKTNINNLFAIGDCIQYKGRSRTIVNGLGDGSKVIWYIYKEIKKPLKLENKNILN